MRQRSNESMNQWSKRTSTQWTSESMTLAYQNIHEYERKTMDGWDRWMDGWVTEYFFAELLLHWPTSSLSLRCLFSQLLLCLLFAASCLGCFCSNVFPATFSVVASAAQFFSSRSCNPACSSRVAASLMLSCVQPCQWVLSQPEIQQVRAVQLCGLDHTNPGLVCGPQFFTICLWNRTPATVLCVCFQQLSQVEAPYRRDSSDPRSHMHNPKKT